MKYNGIRTAESDWTGFPRSRNSKETHEQVTLVTPTARENYGTVAISRQGYWKVRIDSTQKLGLAKTF